MTRRLLAALALVLAFGWLAGAPAWAAEAWQAYANPEFGVSTSMPGQAVGLVANDAEGRRVLNAVAFTDDRNRVYLLRVLETPEAQGARDDEIQTALNAAADGAATPDRGPVISRTALTVEGRPALDLVLGPNADGRYVRARYVVGDGAFIQLLTQQEVPPALDSFFTAFKFIK